MEKFIFKNEFFILYVRLKKNIISYRYKLLINKEYLINKFLDNKINYIEILKNNNIVKSFTIKEIGGFYEAVENILHSDLLFLFDDIENFYKLNENLKNGCLLLLIIIKSYIF